MVVNEGCPKSACRSIWTDYSPHTERPIKGNLQSIFCLSWGPIARSTNRLHFHQARIKRRPAADVGKRFRGKAVDALAVRGEARFVESCRHHARPHRTVHVGA